MEYPKWAPEDLCDLHKNIAMFQQAHSEIYRGGLVEGPDILEYLLLAPEMEKVWKAIRKRCKNSESTGVLFYHAVDASLNPKPREIRTKSANLETLNKIVQLSNELSTLLQEVDLDYPINEYYEEKHARALLKQMVPLGEPTPACFTAKDILRCRMIGGLPNGEVDMQYILENFIINKNDLPFPTTSQLLDALANQAKSTMEEDAFITKANTLTARRTFFVKSLTRHCLEHYKTPLREVVATLTRVLFEQEMDADTVRKLSAGVKPRNFTVE